MKQEIKGALHLAIPLLAQVVKSLTQLGGMLPVPAVEIRVLDLEQVLKLLLKPLLE